MKKRLFCLLIVTLLIASMLPAQALARGGDSQQLPGITAKLNAGEASCGENEIKIRYEAEDGSLLVTQNAGIGLKSNFNVRASVFAQYAPAGYEFVGAYFFAGDGSKTAVRSFQNLGQSNGQYSSNIQYSTSAGDQAQWQAYNPQSVLHLVYKATSSATDPVQNTSTPAPAANNPAAAPNSVTYTINYGVNDSAMGTVSRASEEVTEGGNAQGAVAAANSGYQFVKWTKVGDSSFTGTRLTLAPTNVQANESYVAVFEAIPATNYTINYGVNDSAMGSVTRASETVAAGGNALGATAQAQTGYQFVGWYLRETPVSTNATLAPTNVQANANYEARFEAIPPTNYTINYGVNDSAMGSVTRATEAVAAGGNALGATAQAQTGYQFVKWTDAQGNTVSTNATLAPTNVQAGASYVAVFEAVPVTNYTINYGVNDSAMGSVTRATETVAAGGNALGATAQAQTGYRFVGWYLRETPVSTNATFAPTNVQAGANYVARFEAIPATNYTINYGVNDSAMGTVTRATENVTAGGNALGSTAQAKTGYRFVKWTDAQGNTVSTNATLAPTNVQAGASYVAVFEAIPATNYTINYSSSNTVMGTVSRASETVTAGGNALGSTAQAKTGYRFVKWTDAQGNTVSTNATLAPTNVQAGASYVAVFEAIPASGYTISYSSGNTAMGYVGRISETVATGGTALGSTAYAYSGFRFVKWTDAQGNTISTSATLRPANVQANASYVAVFETIPSTSYAVNYSTANSGMGYVSRTYESVAAGGTALGSTATAYSGYRFVKWIDAQGNTVSTEAAFRPANVQAAVSYRAVFEPATQAGVYTIAIPITKVVQANSGVNPGSASFRFEAFSFQSATTYRVASDTVYTSGTGTFAGYLTLTVTDLNALNALCNGFFIREVNGGSSDWSYSTATWYVKPSYTIDANNNVTISVSVHAVTTGSVVSTTPSASASFTNTCLRNAATTGTNITVNMKWVGASMSSGYVQLYYNNAAYGPIVELNARNNWTYTWYDMKGNGTWRVDEVNVPAGFTRTVSQSGMTFTITNTYKSGTGVPQTGAVSILGYVLVGASLAFGLLGKRKFKK